MTAPDSVTARLAALEQAVAALAAAPVGPVPAGAATGKPESGDIPEPAARPDSREAPTRAAKDTRPTGKDTGQDAPDDVQGPSMWCWRYLDEKQAAQQWADLTDFVDFVTGRYPKALRDLPPCWHLHGDAVEELTALWEAWAAAYYGSDAPRDAPMLWHDRYLPGVTGRLLGPAGILTGCATARKHRDVNLTGAPRNNFDPVLDEHPAPTPAAQPRA